MVDLVTTNNARPQGEAATAGAVNIADVQQTATDKPQFTPEEAFWFQQLKLIVPPGIGSVTFDGAQLISSDGTRPALKLSDDPTYKASAMLALKNLGIKPGDEIMFSDGLPTKVKRQDVSTAKDEFLDPSAGLMKLALLVKETKQFDHLEIKPGQDTSGSTTTSAQNQKNGKSGFFGFIAKIAEIFLPAPYKTAARAVGELLT